MTEVLYSAKIKPEHLARKAIIYLRQSSERQVRQNKESQLLQYAVAERVRALGWEQVEIINSDLGSSAGIASYARCDHRRKSGRFRGHEPGNCDAPLAPRDRSGVPVCRGEGGIPPFRRSGAFRQSRDHTRLRSDRLARLRDQRFEAASLQQ